MSSKFLGKQIGILTNTKERFIGTLVDVSAANKQLTLSNVICKGTEGRDAPQSVEGSHEVVKFKKFASESIEEIKMLEIVEETHLPPVSTHKPAPVPENAWATQSLRLVTKNPRSGSGQAGHGDGPVRTTRAAARQPQAIDESDELSVFIKAAESMRNRHAGESKSKASSSNSSAADASTGPAKTAGSFFDSFGAEPRGGNYRPNDLTFGEGAVRKHHENEEAKPRNDRQRGSGSAATLQGGLPSGPGQRTAGQGQRSSQNQGQSKSASGQTQRTGGQTPRTNRYHIDRPERSERSERRPPRGPRNQNQNSNQTPDQAGPSGGRSKSSFQQAASEASLDEWVQVKPRRNNRARRTAN